ncbi:MAG TPA: serine/threonine-protein kinase [Rhodanobacteraceae bacterium]|nr:serine/threonine-protein kinase [Rhodanobacteraceae bacterium]
MDHQRINALFERALSMAPAQRDAWLAAHCGDDAGLRAAVQRLLDADARADGILERGSELIAAVLADAVEVPERFGVWRVVRGIGAGGMGEVWLAERDDGEFTQQAAIKQVAWPTPGLLRRFRGERQILARLEHPGIARLIDGGVDEAGCPYLAMEHVEGVRIDEWVRTQALDARATVKLVLHVCDAVQYAHRALVVHGDIKPANILVDAGGTPKLLDFGIARVLADDADTPASRTRTLAQLLTPDYAAPEQLAGEPITTAVDVYALGVLMYELLSGTRPYRLSRGAGGGMQLPAVAARPPSTAVDGELARAPERRRALRGDLDRIVLTAMAREPGRRYASVEALASDLRAWLDGRAVAARGDGRWYRTRKFVARNRAAVGVVVAAGVLLLAATIFSLHAASAARAQASRAETVTRFLTDMFRFADPKGAPGGLHLTARQMLDAGAQRYDRELRAQPALAAKFSTTLATIYSALGEYDRAIELARNALKRDAIDRGARARALAVLARAQYEKGDYKAAQESIDQARALHAAEDGERSPSVAADIALAGEIARRQGDFKRAETLTQRALAMSKATLEAPNAQIAEELNQLAVLYGDMRRVEDARAPTEQALAMFRALYGDDHLDVAENIVNLGTIDMQTGKVEQALPLFEQAEATYHKLLPVDHPALANTLTDHARALDRLGRYHEAEAKYQEALAMQRKLLGGLHPDVAATLNNMAVLEMELGEVQTAAKRFRTVLDIWAGQGKPDHPLAQISRIHLGSALREEGKLVESEALLRKARTVAQKTFGEAHPIALLAGIQLGVTLRQAGKIAAALAIQEAVDRTMRGAKRLPPLFKAKADVQYALTELASGKLEQARTRVDSAAQAIAAMTTVDPVSRGEVLLAQARIDLAQGDSAAGCSAARDAANLARQALGAANVRTRRAESVGAPCAAK